MASHTINCVNTFPLISFHCASFRVVLIPFFLRPSNMNIYICVLADIDYQDKYLRQYLYH